MNRFWVYIVFILNLNMAILEKAYTAPSLDFDGLINNLNSQEKIPSTLILENDTISLRYSLFLEGKYYYLELTKKDPKRIGYLKTDFYLDQKTLTYKPIGTEYRPTLVFKKEVCDPSPSTPKITTNFKELADVLFSTEKEHMIFDKSCKKKPYAGNEYNQIKNGLLEILNSGQNLNSIIPIENDSKPTEPTVLNKPYMYLACMREHGFHDSINLFIAELQKIKSRQYSLPSLIRCENNAFSGEFANYNKDQTKQLITIETPLSSITKNGTQSIPTYGDILFHELLHAAEYESESIVQAVEGCCGSSLDAKDCKIARKLLDRDINRKIVVVAFSQELEPETNEFVGKLSTLLGDQAKLEPENGDEAKLDAVFFSFVSRHLKAIERGRLKYANEVYTDCLAQNKLNNLECLNLSKKEIADRFGSHIDKNCKDFFNGDRNKCESVKTALNVFLDKSFAKSCKNTDTKLDEPCFYTAVEFMRKRN